VCFVERHDLIRYTASRNAVDRAACTQARWAVGAQPASSASHSRYLRGPDGANDVQSDLRVAISRPLYPSSLVTGEKREGDDAFG